MWKVVSVFVMCLGLAACGGTEDGLTSMGGDFVFGDDGGGTGEGGDFITGAEGS